MRVVVWLVTLTVLVLTFGGCASTRPTAVHRAATTITTTTTTITPTATTTTTVPLPPLVPSTTTTEQPYPPPTSAQVVCSLGAILATADPIFEKLEGHTATEQDLEAIGRQMGCTEFTP
jgi:hypothetical protein